MKGYILILSLFFLISCFGCQKNKEVKEFTPKEKSITEGEINPVKEIPKEVTPIEKMATNEKTVLQQEIPGEKTELQPSPEDIQTALKNAGFYTGQIDGKIGPETIEAINKFQQENNLKVDGKVGPKTWAVLKKYLTIPTEVKTSEIRD